MTLLKFAGILILVVLLAWTQALDIFGVDNTIEQQLLGFAGNTVGRAPDDDIRLIYINETGNGSLGNFREATERQAWRAHHAKLIHLLADAEAKLVAFDLVFPHPIKKHQDANDELVNAIQSVRENKTTHVLIGHDNKSDMDKDIIAAVGDLRSFGKLGVARELQQPGVSGRTVAEVVIAEASISALAGGVTRQKSVLPQPMPWALLSAAQDTIPSEQGAPEIRGGELYAKKTGIKISIVERECRATTLNCPAEEEATAHRWAMLPIWMGGSASFIERSYASVVQQETLSTDYKGKIVIVGARVPEDKLNIDGSSTVWGYQAYARILADVKHGTYLRRPATYLQVLILALAITVGAFARRFFRGLEVKVPVPFLGSLALPLALFVCFIGVGLLAVAHLAQAAVLHQISYHWLALITGYYVLGRASKKDEKSITEGSGS